jgi:hypothetical protein
MAGRRLQNEKIIRAAISVKLSRTSILAVPEWSFYKMKVELHASTKLHFFDLRINVIR